MIIVDYGGQNLNSILFSLERLGIKAQISRNPKEILEAEKLILPGVGHFDRCMESLEKGQLVPILQNFRKPILGICIGMQVLFESSEEGKKKGLSIFPGHLTQVHGRPSPHMGWNQVEKIGQNKLFLDINQESYFYFIHSFYLKSPNLHTIGQTTYQECFASAVNYKNFFGVQFHPEKSGKAGEILLGNFARL